MAYVVDEKGKRPLQSASEIQTPQGQLIYKLIGDLEIKIVGVQRGDNMAHGWYDKVSKKTRYAILNPLLSLTSEATGFYCSAFTSHDMQAKLYHLQMLRGKYYQIQGKMTLLERTGEITRGEAATVASSIMTPLIKMINGQIRNVTDKMRQPNFRM